MGRLCVAVDNKLNDSLAIFVVGNRFEEISYYFANLAEYCE